MQIPPVKCKFNSFCGNRDTFYNIYIMNHLLYSFESSTTILNIWPENNEISYYNSFHSSPSTSPPRPYCNCPLSNIYKHHGQNTMQRYQFSWFWSISGEFHMRRDASHPFFLWQTTKFDFSYSEQKSKLKYLDHESI